MWLLAGWSTTIRVLSGPSTFLLNCFHYISKIVFSSLSKLADTPSDIANTLLVNANVTELDSNQTINERTPQNIYEAFRKQYDERYPHIENLGLGDFVLFVRIMNQAINTANSMPISVRDEPGFYDHLVLWYRRYCKTEFNEKPPKYVVPRIDRASSWVQADDEWETSMRTHFHDRALPCPPCERKKELNDFSRDGHVLDATSVKIICEWDLSTI
ncbi:hypothetical protein H2200_010466 [Cladophialophora chaetospira]|uniref:Sulfhydryl oxidase n=1 Tax=Cladophialophora chaetospira TaxID=386627 RepID=A0AA39CE91_9EURO|nr:hypothetical protein H2200_010466 [Cladophialophora chaetospira]